MRIVPVLDVLHGQVVRGIAGRRSEYRPIVSMLTDSTEPVAVAGAIQEKFGWSEFYVADLDAIMGAEPTWSLYAALHAHGHRLWIDAGVRDAGRALQLIEAEVSRPILGLETVADPTVVEVVCAQSASRRCIFSLDLCNGKAIHCSDRWDRDAVEVASKAIQAGIRAILVLDLARVGTTAGVGTEPLCQELSRLHPDVELMAGGGVRTVDDVRRLQDCGVQTALVASALHDGRLSPEALAHL